MKTFLALALAFCLAALPAASEVLNYSPLPLATDAQTRTGTATGVVVQPSNLTARGGFSATKSGSQTGIVDVTDTVLTFDTETYDVGSWFTANAWTPAAGLVSLTCNTLITGTLDATASAVMYIRKNGTSIAANYNAQPIAAVGLALAAQDTANGTDAYTCVVNINVTSGTSTATGAIAGTTFMGMQQ